MAYAASSANADEAMLRLLVEAGANVSALVAESESFPLGLAAGSGSVEKVQVLLDAAIYLYRSFGFAETEPYTNNPIPGALFMEMTLDD